MGLAARASITSLNNANAVPTLLEMKRAAPSRADTVESRLLRLIRKQTLVAIRDAAAAMEMAILDARQILASLEQQGIVIELSPTVALGAAQHSACSSRRPTAAAMWTRYEGTHRAAADLGGVSRLVVSDRL